MWKWHPNFRVSDECWNIQSGFQTETEMSQQFKITVWNTRASIFAVVHTKILTAQMFWFQILTERFQGLSESIFGQKLNWKTLESWSNVDNTCAQWHFVHNVEENPHWLHFNWLNDKMVDSTERIFCQTDSTHVQQRFSNSLSSLHHSCLAVPATAWLSGTCNWEAMKTLWCKETAATNGWRERRRRNENFSATIHFVSIPFFISEFQNSPFAMAVIARTCPCQWCSNKTFHSLPCQLFGQTFCSWSAWKWILNEKQNQTKKFCKKCTTNDFAFLLETTVVDSIAMSKVTHVSVMVLQCLQFSRSVPVRHCLDWLNWRGSLWAFLWWWWMAQPPSPMSLFFVFPCSKITPLLQRHPCRCPHRER